MQSNRHIKTTAAELGEKVFVNVEMSAAWVELMYKRAARTESPFFSGTLSNEEILARAQRLDLFQELWNTLPESVKVEVRKRIML